MCNYKFSDLFHLNLPQSTLKTVSNILYSSHNSIVLLKKHTSKKTPHTFGECL